VIITVPAAIAFLTLVVGAIRTRMTNEELAAIDDVF
jgi:hypothetical protein